MIFTLLRGYAYIARRQATAQATETARGPKDDALVEFRNRRVTRQLAELEVSLLGCQLRLTFTLNAMYFPTRYSVPMLKIFQIHRSRTRHRCLVPCPKRSRVSESLRLLR